MFIIVTFGEGEQVYVNPNCHIKLIIEYLRIKCEIQDDTEIDLCNAAGKLLSIYKEPYSANGLDIFTRRETYFLVTHERSSRGHLKKPKLAISVNLNQYDYLRNRITKSRSIEIDRRGDSKKLSTARTSTTPRSKPKLSKNSDLKYIVNVQVNQNVVAEHKGDIK